jgi:hypothetical protein
VNTDSQPLHGEPAFSGASQALSGGSPVNGGSSASRSVSRGMGGMQVSSVGSPGFIGGLQAASIVSPINATSQEPLEDASSAPAVHSPSQPDMAEDRQPVTDNVTNPTSLEAGSLPTHTTTDVRSFVVLVALSVLMYLVFFAYQDTEFHHRGFRIVQRSSSRALGPFPTTELVL